MNFPIWVRVTSHWSDFLVFLQCMIMNLVRVSPRWESSATTSCGSDTPLGEMLLHTKVKFSILSFEIVPWRVDRSPHLEEDTIFMIQAYYHIFALAQKKSGYRVPKVSDSDIPRAIRHPIQTKWYIFLQLPPVIMNKQFSPLCRRITEMIAKRYKKLTYTPWFLGTSLSYLRLMLSSWAPHFPPTNRNSIDQQEQHLLQTLDRVQLKVEEGCLSPSCTHKRKSEIPWYWFHIAWKSRRFCQWCW